MQIKDSSVKVPDSATVLCVTERACVRAAGGEENQLPPPHPFFFFNQSLKVSHNLARVHTESLQERERMCLLFLLPFLKLCCSTNQVKPRGKRRRADSTQIFKTPSDPSPV